MPLQNFIDAWDDIIDKWMNNQNELSLLKVSKKLDINFMPEPSNGNPFDCSIVMINLNPGQGHCSLCWKNQNTPNTYVNDADINKYNGFALPFPFLTTPPSTPSSDWWIGKNRKGGRWAYLEKLLSWKGVQPNNPYKNPLAIELCALHSDSIAGINFGKYLTALKSFDPNLDPINIIEIAIQNSDAKFGFAVGKPIYDALKSYGYTDIQIPNHHNVKNAKGNPNARQFAVVEKNGAKVLCTWTSGGNSCPSAAFDSYIKQNIIPLLP